MKKIKILDCTLRDGGYCNNWRFGYEEICQIINNLMKANVDIIECGFISNKTDYDKDVSKYSTLTQIAGVLPKNKQNTMFVAMMNFGEFETDELPVYDGHSIDGIRVAFHKKDRYRALEVCKQIKEKGYKVFVQPMVSLAYTDEEFTEMIRLVNEIQPYAFYIVDSFGRMRTEDLLRLYDLVSETLTDDIWIGYHSHNNMQLAFSNAQSLCSKAKKDRNLIIDTSIFGMGRGAGNLNTELFVDFANGEYGLDYKLNPLLEVIDKILAKFYKTNYWGYSLPNYLSAVHNAHPNYANFLSDKNTLTVEDINHIFSLMEDSKKLLFDKKYIETLYTEYMSDGDSEQENITRFQNLLTDKTVLLVAPGRSAFDERDKIVKKCSEENIISISVNFQYAPLNTDFVFISNLRRYRDLTLKETEKYIVSSNIPIKNAFLKIDYKEWLCNQDSVVDNAGLMLINFLISCGCKKILLAGFDGYSHENEDNYADKKMELISKNAVLDAINLGMNKVLSEYAKKTKIEFLTQQKYIKL